jgi:hypothetical protein
MSGLRRVEYYIAKLHSRTRPRRSTGAKQSTSMLFATDGGFVRLIFLPLIWAFFGIPSIACGWHLTELRIG